MKKYLALGLIMTGIILIAYPFYLNYKENKWLDELTLSYLEQREYNLIVSEDSPVDSNKDIEVDKSGVVGLIIIPTIDVSLPILYDATDANLNKGAAMVKDSSFPWEGGNTAIAAHNGRTRGRLFNRLNEIKQDDEIILEFQNKQFIYKVYDIFIVDAYDIEILWDIPNKTTATLITCSGDDRLIIKGELIKVEKLQISNQ